MTRITPTSNTPHTDTRGGPALRLSRPRSATWLAVFAAALAIGLAAGLAGPRGDATARAQEPATTAMRSGDVGHVVALPLLAASELGGATCEPRVTVQSLGDQPARGVVVVWDRQSLGTCEGCFGPARVACTGLLAPGQSWSLGAAELGAAARSAMVVGWAGDDPCAALAAEIVGQCDGWPAFLARYAAGSPFPGGGPAGAAAPIAATVDRVCDGVGAFGPGHSAYAGAARGIAEVAEPPSRTELALPVLTQGTSGVVDTAWVQNTGTECVTVIPRVKAYDDVVRLVECTPIVLAPGETAMLDLDWCAVEGTGTYVAWLTADGPIAAVVERREGAGRAAWNAVDVPETPEDGATTLFAPLVRDSYQGWDTVVYAFNADVATSVKAKVYFLDRSGGIQTTMVDWVHPHTVQAFKMPIIDALDGNWTGSVRVQSLPPLEDSTARPPAIVGAVVMTRWAETSRNTVISAAAEPLLPADRGFLWPEEVGAGGLESGVGLIAIPEVMRLADDGRVEASDLAITNLVAKPGFTDIAVFFHDASGLVDVVCMRLNERAVDRIEVGNLGFLGNAYRGSAVISAVSWSHDVYNGNGQWQRNVVGLAATAERRNGAVADAGGDALALVGAVPLAGPDRALFAGTLEQPCQVPTPGTPRPTPQPTVSSLPPPRNTATLVPPPSGPTPTPDPDPARRHDAVTWLPRVAGDEAGCDPWLHVNNLGGEPAKAILMVWGEPGECGDMSNGPMKVECSGLIRPGNTWAFIGAQVPYGARSGLILGVSTRKLSEIGITSQPDDIVADYLCESLFFGVIGDAFDYLQFRSAIETGGLFADLPMDRVLFGPMVVTIESRCLRDASDPQSRGLVDATTGIPGDRLGRPDGATGRWRYDLPLLHDMPVGLPTWPPSEVWLQNTGLECATVVVRWRGHADCGAPQSQTLDIAPGESGRFLPMLGPATWGGGWVESTQPLAVQVMVDYATGRAVYNAPAAAAGLAEVDVVAYAPLVYNGYRSWSTRLHIQNRSADTEARVLIEVLNRSGNVVATTVHSICPNGTDAVALESISGIPSNWVGSVRLTSTRWFSASDPEAVLPEIAGVVELVRSGPVAGDTADISEVAVYPLLAASAGFAPKAEGDSWAGDGSDDGAKVLALGAMVKAGGRETATSQIVVANLVAKPGFTDVVFYFYDQNGLLDYICHKLVANEVEFIDLQTWGYINPGFKGSALVSAMFWQHDVYDAEGEWAANLVGLGAVTLHTPAETSEGFNRTDHDGPGDTSSAWLGVPLGLGADPGSPILPLEMVIPPLCGTGPPSERVTPTAGPPMVAQIFLPGTVSQAPIVPAPYDETPTTAPPTATDDSYITHTPGPTNTPAPTPTQIAFEDLGPSVVHLPAFHYQGERDTCDATVTVQSVGDEPTFAALVVWSERGRCTPSAAGPMKVECSGLIRPGSAWHFTVAQIPSGTNSGAVYSFNARKLSDIGVTGREDDIVGYYLCENLFFGAVGDADDFRRFDLAYRNGTTFFDVPMARAYGAPLVVDVNRRCVDGWDDARVHHAAGYNGVDLALLGAEADGRWRYGLGPLYAGTGARHSLIHVQNAGNDCASATLSGLAPGTCEPIELTTILAIAPGEAAIVDLGAAGLAGDLGAGWVEGSQPLALVVDAVSERGPDAMLTARGAIPHKATSGLSGGDQRWYSPLTYSEYQGWETVVAVQNLDLARPAKVAVLFVDRIGSVIARHVDWICPGGGRRFVLPLVETLPGHWVGAAQANSQEIELDGVRYPPRQIAASLEGYRYDRPAGLGSIQEAFALDMVPAASVEGNARLAYPLVTKRQIDGLTGLDTSTELIVGNAIADPGRTDVAIYLFDQNGLLDYVCLQLGPGFTEYVDLATWGHVNHGFVGTGIVSAVHWTHQGGALVGLVGATARREGADIGQSVPSDELSVNAAWPLAHPMPLDLGRALCPEERPLTTVTPRPRPTSTPLPLPTATLEGGASPTPAGTNPPPPTWRSGRRRRRSPRRSAGHDHGLAGARDGQRRSSAPSDAVASERNIQHLATACRSPVTFPTGGR